MRIDLSARTAVVTGSSSGIGLAIAMGLASAGARVVVNGRSDGSVAATVDRVRAAHPTAEMLGVAADVTTDEGAATLLEAAGVVDVLVNNLGIFGAVEALEIDDDAWRRMLDVNVLAAVRLTRMALPAMIERGWGRVLSIASDSAVAIPAEMIHYGVSKTALVAASRGFAKAAAGTGVTVNSVIAGPTHTGGVEDFVHELVGSDLPWE